MPLEIYLSLILAVSALSVSVEQDIFSSFELPRCSLESASEGLVVHGDVMIKKNRLAGIIPEWGSIFRVAFELKIEHEIKLPDDWIDVLKVTNQTADQDYGVPGRAVPGVWLCNYEQANELCGPNSTCLQIGSYISSNYNEAVCSLNISRDRFTSIEIAQWEIDGVYFFDVYMDGKLYAQMQNRTPANFTNMNIFTTNNIFVSFGVYGQMRNLEVATWHQQPTDCYISKP